MFLDLCRFIAFTIIRRLEYKKNIYALECRNHLTTFKCAKRIVQAAGVIQNKPEKYSRIHVYVPFHIGALHTGIARNIWLGEYHFYFLVVQCTDINHKRYNTAFHA